jgi:23S rRNA (guanosine2251-2'-O)-methyltransferase
MKKANVWVAGAALGEGTERYDRADFRRDLALVIGAEGAGLSPVVRKECDFLVEIPVYGQVASLNASVAAGVLLYEVQRQRSEGRNRP